jgi:hypothetical protein
MVFIVRIIDVSEWWKQELKRALTKIPLARLVIAGTKSLFILNVQIFLNKKQIDWGVSVVLVC